MSLTVADAYASEPLCFRQLGTASLRSQDMDTRPHLTPWLGRVYVEESHRRQGIGAALASSVQEKTRSLGFPVLYLFTFDKEAYYGRLGWQLLERTEYRGHHVVVMQKEVRRFEF